MFGFVIGDGCEASFFYLTFSTFDFSIKQDRKVGGFLLGSTRKIRLARLVGKRRGECWEEEQ